ncbi:MAG: beta-aspartyl-peptidase [Bacteroidales bacterium]|nr:beta-aspartyl-peptidase [Bacteroidales bacterium]
MILFKNADLYRPVPTGKKDVLVAGARILAIENRIDAPAGWNIEVIDADGLLMLPGLIDAHVHIAGAGGEGGPASRTPELQLSHLLEAGVSTVVGCLGTDGITRSLESVLMKAKALRQEGVSAWMYTGAYQVPTPTILGDVARDIAMIEEVIGTGEIAISDHRSSVPTTHELIRLAEHSRVGGMLGGKAGIVNIHMGDATDPFRPLYEAVEHSELTLKQFLPTHCNRNHHIFEESKAYGKKGYVDLTTSSYPFFPQYEIKPSKAIAELLKAGVPPAHITMSSDGFGSLPQFDENGNLVQLETGHPKSVFEEMRDAIVQEGLPAETAIATVTENVARILRLPGKGRIATGMDADLLIIDKDFTIVHMCAMGSMMIKNKNMLKKGAYE